MYLSIKRIKAKLKETFKFMSVFLIHIKWVFRAFKDEPFIYFFWSIPVNVYQWRYDILKDVTL